MKKIILIIIIILFNSSYSFAISFAPCVDLSNFEYNDQCYEFTGQETVSTLSFGNEAISSGDSDCGEIHSSNTATTRTYTQYVYSSGSPDGDSRTDVPRIAYTFTKNECPECIEGTQISVDLPNGTDTSGSFCVNNCTYIRNGIGVSFEGDTSFIIEFISTGATCSSNDPLPNDPIVLDPAVLTPLPDINPDGSCPFGFTCTDENGNLLDSDSDGDGIGDLNDAFPYNPNEDTDSDGDGVGDNSDEYPDNPEEDIDSDGDGVGDNEDLLPDDPDNSSCPDGLICPNDGVCQDGEDPLSSDCVGEYNGQCPEGEICPNDGVCQDGEDPLSKDCRSAALSSVDFTPLSGAISNLSTKFPASLGSSILDLFSLIDVTPVAPEFNFEFPEGHYFDVTLTVFDPVVLIFRWLIGFALIGYTLTRSIKLWSGSNA